MVIALFDEGLKYYFGIMVESIEMTVISVYSKGFSIGRDWKT